MLLLTPLGLNPAQGPPVATYQTALTIRAWTVRPENGGLRRALRPGTAGSCLPTLRPASAAGPVRDSPVPLASVGSRRDWPAVSGRPRWLDLTLELGKIGLSGSTSVVASRPPRRPQMLSAFVVANAAANFSAIAARTTMVPDFAHVGFTAEIPLPNQGFPARFLEWCRDKPRAAAGEPRQGPVGRFPAGR